MKKTIIRFTFLFLVTSCTDMCFVYCDKSHIEHIDNEVSRFLENAYWVLKERFKTSVPYLKEELEKMNSKLASYEEWEQEHYERLRDLIDLIEEAENLKQKKGLEFKDLSHEKNVTKADDDLESLYSLDKDTEALFDDGTNYPRIKEDGLVLFKALEAIIKK